MSEDEDYQNKAIVDAVTAAILGGAGAGDQIDVFDMVAPWTCKVCGALVLDHEVHGHSADQWREESSDE